MALSTGNISLQDVVDEVGTTPDGNGEYTLLRSFAEANSYGFDPTYEGSKNSLYNFKGYDDSILQTLNIFPVSSTVGSGAGNIQVDVTTNGEWSVALGYDSWVTVDQYSTYVIVNYEANNVGSTSQRTTEVHFLKEDGSTSTKFFTLTQEGTQ